MTGDRDGLLDGWADQQRRLATLEASIVLAVDLLTETVTAIDPHQRPALHTAIRMFLLNVPVGARL